MSGINNIKNDTDVDIFSDSKSGNPATEDTQQDGSQKTQIVNELGYVASIDSSTHSLQTITYEHHELHSGSHYFHNDVHDLAINNVLDYTFTTPDTTEQAHILLTFSTESETQYHLYEGATIITPGTANGHNSNRNSTNTPTMTVREISNSSLTNANADTDVSGATTLWSGIVGAGKDGGSNNRSNEIILKRNTTYCLRLVASSAGYINVDFQWYGHTPKS